MLIFVKKRKNERKVYSCKKTKKTKNIIILLCLQKNKKIKKEFEKNFPPSPMVVTP
jgi:hypothetical protein